MLIDSHCHLNHGKNDDTPDELIKRAHAAGVGGLLTINTNITQEFDDILSIAKAHEKVWCTIGTHPHDASNEAEKALSVNDIVVMAGSHEKVIGIGETGLDYFYDNSEQGDQIASFRKHIQVCLETDKPVIIHARDADDDVIQILKEEAAGTNLRGVMHCFSSTQKLADFALEIGFYISLSGMVTFKKFDWLRDIVKTVPHDRLLVETDAPYLAPEPYRGKTNEPAYVVHTAKYVANFLQINENTFFDQTSKNFKTLFKLI
jgi:TatD DNase family protein